MKPRINILICQNLLIAILTLFIINYMYDKYDKNIYKCSKETHMFGLMFPIINIILLNIILVKYVKIKMDFINIGIIISLILSYSMLYFHLIHQYKNN